MQTEWLINRMQHNFKLSSVSLVAWNISSIVGEYLFDTFFVESASEIQILYVKLPFALTWMNLRPFQRKHLKVIALLYFYIYFTYYDSKSVRGMNNYHK